MRTVVAKAPTHIDLAGGMLDIPPLYLFHQPAITINAAINMYVTVEIAPSDIMVVESLDQQDRLAWESPQQINMDAHPHLALMLRMICSFQTVLREKIYVKTQSQAPAGSGLGGSSALAVALASGLAKWVGDNWEEWYDNPERLVEWAKSIETQTIRVPTGYQDYWAAVCGGVRAYYMRLDGIAESQD